MSTIRAKLLATACMLPLLLPTEVNAQQRQARPVRAAAQARVAPGGAISAIKIEGNQRIEESTIRSYMLVQPGDAYDADRVDRSLKSLFSTGLFADVSFQRQGGTLWPFVLEIE